jgi:hypothetical protein
LLTAPHYEELVLPVLRRASPNQGACPMQLVMLSRPCTLSTAQRREAVLHACRLAAAHAATSVQRSCCCTMLLKLINDRHLGANAAECRYATRPLLLGCPSPPACTHMPAACHARYG